MKDAPTRNQRRVQDFRCCTPPFLFLPVTQNYHKALILENSWPCKPFCCGCLYEKKIKKFSSPPPLSEHFEIWVWKPAIAERVKGIDIRHQMFLPMSSSASSMESFMAPRWVSTFFSSSAFIFPLYNWCDLPCGHLYHLSSCIFHTASRTKYFCFLLLHITKGHILCKWVMGRGIAARKKCERKKDKGKRWK